MCVAAEAVRNIVDNPGQPVRSERRFRGDEKTGNCAGDRHEKWALEDGCISLVHPSLGRGAVSFEKQDVVRLEVAFDGIKGEIDVAANEFQAVDGGSKSEVYWDLPSPGSSSNDIVASDPMFACVRSPPTSGVAS